jgi:hypothetical protein
MPGRDRHAELQIHHRLAPRWDHLVFRAVEVHPRRKLGAEAGYRSPLGEELDLKLDGEILPVRGQWVRPSQHYVWQRTTDLESTHGGIGGIGMGCEERMGVVER